ncbi:uncharacterized protein PFL1_00360 [Pseudozyma flocculosa PF-1]|uniref:Probable phosphomannomutase n=1 Tax=Pseudozyma flocculosa TaxID=84751 RepID=A0A5C3ETQ1_9BASI|nr:uncharacterized protein PFL1_00360 [Pseudozyma flocculosa PF-1]EPQ32163.1 hypothetical protein PFL1_00360 [Pseudozyma flocculosa PF-1]SPO34897.1 probable phosphomannomutase [Pseudozyma flocculosa]
MAHQELLAKAKAWLHKDPDPTTKQQLASLIERSDFTKLEQCFGDRLEFGTAGLRGIMGVGYSNMNLLTVLESTAGFAQHLLDTDGAKAQSKGVAIAFDGRFGSKEFAYASAQHFAHRGIPSQIYPTPTPTPMCGFAVKRLGLAGGIVVTASHNPKEYNGYKVFGPAGTQINTPTDSQIAAQIDKVAKETEPPALVPLDEAKKSGLVREIEPEMFEAYIRDMKDLQIFSSASSAGDKVPLSMTYSPLHGVGGPFIQQLATEVAGFVEGENFWIVEEQRYPDGAFPTLEFPNPEELSTLELNHKLSEKHKTDLAIVNDPDADRLAVSARDRTGKLRALNGDQLGTLLGDEILRRADARNGGGKKAGVYTLSTIVSSRLLARMSQFWGGRHVETLTGFKWLGNVAMGIEAREGPGAFGAGYEEALGYMVARSVWDKDGLSSFLLIVSLAFDLARQGKTLWDRLEEIHKTVGVSVTSQRIIKLTPGRKGTEIMTKLRKDLDAGKTSVEKDGKQFAFSLVDDLKERPAYDAEKAAQGDLSIPKNDVLRFYVPASHVDPAAATSRPKDEVMLGDTRIIVRPSGTEPKVKIYNEAMGLIQEGEEYSVAVARVERELSEVVDAFWAWMSA